ncbi:MarR family winged helix-turn-helix transcriptional regulator [Microbacterium allomyrinae]|uniref:MarR family transcriptional regulator n=1 Tax=Microbacterium allomyrinae TaxID=2830666 RepID=A0A9X1LXM4_9MICO|nr:MarR family transcriptional regulator [Microbacterium allomyrinae]MCC2033999.1 MarR family transcriptional regulator [Microbacterium allomyrinae]
MSERISFTLHELIAELDAYADDVLRQHYGVSFNHFQFLAILSEVEPADMTTLARCLGVTKAAVSKRVPALVDGGWITARSEQGAGRSILLTLTPKGADLVRTAGTALETEFTAMLADPALDADPIDVPRLNRQLAALTGLVMEKSAARIARTKETAP